MNFAILGKSGSGKSTLARSVVQKLATDKKMIVLDNSDDHIKIPGIKRLMLDESRARKVSPAKLIENYERVLIETEYLAGDTLKSFINDLCLSVWHAGNIVLMIDEAHLFFPKFGYPAELEKLIRTARKRAIDLVFVTQQFTDLNSTALKQAHVLCFFKFTDVNELRMLKEYGIDTAACGQLPQYSYIVKNCETSEIEVCKPINI